MIWLFWIRILTGIADPDPKAWKTKPDFPPSKKAFVPRYGMFYDLL
jgi:hypothetical protein